MSCGDTLSVYLKSRITQVPRVWADESGNPGWGLLTVQEQASPLSGGLLCGWEILVMETWFLSQSLNQNFYPWAGYCTSFTKHNSYKCALFQWEPVSWYTACAVRVSLLWIEFCVPAHCPGGGGRGWALGSHPWWDQHPTERALPFPLSAQWQPGEKAAIWEERPHHELNSDLRLPEPWENKHWLFKPFDLWKLVMKAWADG